jgi:hypothetical protein
MASIDGLNRWHRSLPLLLPVLLLGTLEVSLKSISFKILHVNNAQNLE